MPEQPPTVRTRVPSWTGAPELGPIGVAVAWVVVAVAWGALALARDGAARALLSAGSPWTWLSLVVLGGGIVATGAVLAVLARRGDRVRVLVVAPAVLALAIAAAAASSIAPSAPSAPEGAAAIARGAAAAARAHREADAFGAGALGLAVVALLLGCASTALATRAMKRAVARRLAAEAWLALSLGLLVAIVSASVAGLALSGEGGAPGVRGVALALGLALAAGGVLGAVAAATALAGSAESRDDHVGALGDLFGALALALAGIVAASGAAKARLGAAAFAAAAAAPSVAASVHALSVGTAGAVAARWAGLMFALPVVVAAVAVVAPRRALVASAVGDAWPVPASAFVLAVAAWLAAGARLGSASSALLDAEGARFPSGVDPVALAEDALASASAPDEASVIVVRRDDAAATTDPAACAAKLADVDRRRKDHGAPRAYDVLVDERAPAAVLACLAAAARDGDATLAFVVRAPEARDGDLVVRDVAVAVPVRVAGKGEASDAVAHVHVTAAGATLERLAAAAAAPAAPSIPSAGTAATAAAAAKPPKEETRAGTGRELSAWVRDAVPVGTIVVSADPDAPASSVLPLLAPRAPKGADAVFAPRRDDAEPGGASSSAPAPPPAVLAAVTASGGMKQDAADKAVREHVTAFARCGPTEAVTLEATVGARGVVAHATKLGATKQDHVTVTCLLRALSGVKFPRSSHRHAKVVVSFARAAP